MSASCYCHTTKNVAVWVNWKCHLFFGAGLIANNNFLYWTSHEKRHLLLTSTSIKLQWFTTCTRTLNKNSLHTWSMPRICLRMFKPQRAAQIVAIEAKSATTHAEKSYVPRTADMTWKVWILGFGNQFSYSNERIIFLFWLPLSTFKVAAGCKRNAFFSYLQFLELSCCL